MGEGDSPRVWNNFVLITAALIHCIITWMKKRYYVILISLIILIILAVNRITTIFVPQKTSKKASEQTTITPSISKIKHLPDLEFHGPRYGAENVPNEYGFWSFAIVEPGKLSRSGQPNKVDFSYLKKAGYKTIVSFRYPHEYDEETDDSVIAGQINSGINYINIPMKDGAAPTTKQAEMFLHIVKNSAGPIHIHCRGGIGRAGVMTALYRFEIDGWPMDKAIEESRLFEGGVDDTQRNWLLNWARQNKK